jgi:rhodanese-related sulfurtransferase
MNKTGETRKTNTATIVDVRTREEYAGGHVAGSINIPLNEVPDRLAEFGNMSNVVVCCASGARSAQAAMFLQRNGISCVNGGSWMDVNYQVNR